LPCFYHDCRELSAAGYPTAAKLHLLLRLLARMAVSPTSERPQAARDCLSEYKMKSADLRRPETPEKMGRSSFSSVRENDDGVAQTFTSTRVSSYAHGHEEAIDDSSSVGVEMAKAEFIPPITQPFSKLHGCWYPANSFRGWKQINVQGKTKTRSFGDLQTLNMMWNTPSRPTNVKQIAPPGGSPMEKLPIELLGTWLLPPISPFLLKHTLTNSYRLHY
jgi:hypothetical protein